VSSLSGPYDRPSLSQYSGFAKFRIELAPRVVFTVFFIWSLNFFLVKVFLDSSCISFAWTTPQEELCHRSHYPGLCDPLYVSVAVLLIGSLFPSNPFFLDLPGMQAPCKIRSAVA